MAYGSSPARTIMFVAGTRPEALKLAPIIHALKAGGRLHARLCATAQHRELLDGALADCGLSADADLGLMRDGQTPGAVTAAVVAALGPLLAANPPAALVVQGDTATALGGALAGAYARVPVAHVEAGLRSGSDEPFPEEMHRRLIGRLADIHFAPTAAARAALLREGVARAAVSLTGNTAIDAVHATARRLDAEPGLAEALARRFAGIDRARPLVLATVHRRENHGPRLDSILDGLATLALLGAEVVLPVHPAPRVAHPAARALGGRANIHLLPPLDHAAFVWLLRRARLVLTDSGGVQEEAPAFGVPVLVLRTVTERPEGVAAGVARLIGTRAGDIVAAAGPLLHDDALHGAMARAVLPYGDGRAGPRIARILEQCFADRPVAAPRRGSAPRPRASAGLAGVRRLRPAAA